MVHRLSCPNTGARTQTLKILIGDKRTRPSIPFHYVCMVDTQILAHMFNSFVRVSRLSERDHVVRKKDKNQTTATKCHLRVNADHS